LADPDDQVAALTHPGLIPAAEVRRLIEAPLPTGTYLRWRRLVYRTRLKAAAWIDRPMGLLDRLPGLRGRVGCPLCGWQGAWFRPQVSGGRIRPTMRCPQCGSGRRHRLFWLAWRAQRSAYGSLCLHMAPEDWLAPLLAADVSSVITMDIESGGVDVKADAAQLPFGEGVVDTIICNDVLEHMADDRQALREIARVLTESGTAFLHTPVVSTETVEYGFVNLIDHGHRRAYGPDLVRRVRDAGLDLSLFTVSDLNRSERRRCGLPDPDVVLISRRPESVSG
jgi:SAM-dependent methyltransferase